MGEEVAWYHGAYKVS